MRRKNLAVALLSLIAVFLSGCEKNIDPDTLKIRYGTSFGFCLGYCTKGIEVSKAQVKFTKSSRQDSLKAKTCTKPIDDTAWSALAKKIDYKRFSDLKEVIGCPDCADGGSEWIEIEAGNSKHKVVFEYGNEPEPVKEYIDELRELQATFSDCN